MTREEVLNLYAGTSISQEELEELLDSMEKYNMLGIFNVAKELTTIEARDNYLLTTVKNIVATRTLKRIEVENKKFNQGLEKIDKYIKKEILQHVDSIREDSNREVSNYYEYSSKCMLKAFAIEYMLKTICIMSNTPRDVVKNFSPESYNTEQKMRSLMKDTKTKLEAQIKLNNPNDDRRRSGHEIDEILNNIIPKHIRTLIKYRSIANYANDEIANKGQLPRKKDKSSDSFVADYFLMTRDFTPEEDKSKSLMSDTAAQHNKIYNENNKAFEQYRYQDKLAGFQDYNMLNSLMIATEMTLEYLLNNRSLAVELAPGETISYDMVSQHLTKDEYDHLLEISNNNGYDTNDLLYYHTFLKEYLEERTPKLTDDRYRRINQLFQEIKNAKDISTTGEMFAQWYKNISINDLTREELDELNVIAPEYIYNSLNYTDKLIYEKCKANNIEFQFYYRINPESLDKMINLYGQEFAGKKFGENFVSCNIGELQAIEAILAEHNLKLSDVPDYYFRYDSEIIKRCCEKTNGIALTEEGLTQTLEDSIVESYKEWGVGTRHYTQPIELDMVSTRDIQGVRTMLAYNRAFHKKEVETINEIIDIITTKGIKTYEGVSKHIQVSSQDFYKAKYIADIKRLAKVEDISQYTRMSIPQLSGISFKLRRQENSQSKDKLILDSMIPGKNSAAVTIVENTEEYKQVQNLLNETKVNPNMKFLREVEVLHSYYKCREYLNTQLPSEEPIKIGEPFLYRTTNEVKDIISICQRNAIPTFRTEYLYFSPEEFESNIHILPFLVEASLNALTNSEENLSYENARKNLDTCRIFNPHQQQYRPQPYERDTASNELGEMLSETSKQGNSTQSSQIKK